MVKRNRRYLSAVLALSMVLSGGGFSMIRTESASAATETFFWKVSDYGEYAFSDNGSSVWTSENAGIGGSISQTTWSVEIPFEVADYELPWSVSSESGYDKMTVVLDSETVVSGESGEKSGVVVRSLSAGRHTLTAKYVKDVSGNSGLDEACLELPAFSFDGLCDSHNWQTTKEKHSCDVCGIDMRHPYESEITLDATCTKEGEKKYSCETCGFFYTEPIGELGHEYDDEVTKVQTCTQAGIKTYSCIRGDDTYTEEIAPDGHDYALSGVEYEDGSQVKGTATYACTACGDVYSCAFEESYVFSFELGEDGESYLVGLDKDSVLNQVEKLYETLYIPDTYNGLPVTQIRDNGFVSSHHYKKIVIGDNVTSIGKNAFKNSCGYVEELVIGENVKTLGNNCFQGLGMYTEGVADVTVPDGIKVLGNAFSFAKLDSFDTGSVEIIESDALSQVSAKKCVIGGEVLYIDETAFSNMTIGELVFEDSENDLYLERSAFNNVSLASELKVPYRVCAEQAAFDQVNGYSSVVYNGRGVTGDGCIKEGSSVYEWTFDDAYNYYDKVIYNTAVSNGITSLVIGDNIKMADSAGVFSVIGSGLESVELGKQISLFPGNAFAGAGKSAGLKQVIMNTDKPVIVGEEAFGRGGQAMEKFLTPNSYIGYIGDSAFYGMSSLQSVDVSDAYYIGVDALNGVPNTAFAENGKVTLDNILVIGGGAFQGSGITGVTFSDNAQSIDMDAFEGCVMEELVLPHHVLSLGDSNYGSGLVKVKKLVYDIDLSYYDAKGGYGAFYSIEELYPSKLLDEMKELGLGGTQVEVGTGWSSGHPLVYFDLNYLEDVTFKCPYTDVISRGFLLYGCSNLKHLSIGKRSGLFKTHANTSLEDVVLDATVTQIPDACFSGCTSLKEVTGVDGLVQIGNSAFASCSNLMKFAFEDTKLESVGEYAFAGTFSVYVPSVSGVSICMPQTLQSMGGSAFNGCAGVEEFRTGGLDVLDTSVELSGMFPKLKRLYLEDSLTSLTDVPGCGSSIEYIYLGDGLSDSIVSQNAFLNSATGLKTLEMGDGIREIPTAMCAGLTSLEKVSLPASLYSVGTAAFSGCSGLQEILLPDGLVNISSAAFQGTGIKEIEIPNTVEGIASSAFTGCASLEKLEFEDLPETEDVSLHSLTLGGQAFAGCSSLKSVRLPNTLKELLPNVFTGCMAITELYLNTQLGSIGDGAFNNYPNLSKVYCYRYSAYNKPTLTQLQEEGRMFDGCADDFKFVEVYSVDYYLDGDMPQTELVEYDTKGALLESDAKKDSMSLIGWALSPDGMVKYKSGTQVKNIVDEYQNSISLYAVYGEEIPLVVNGDFADAKAVVTKDYEGTETISRNYHVVPGSSLDVNKLPITKTSAGYIYLTLTVDGISEIYKVKVTDSNMQSLIEYGLEFDYIPDEIDESTDDIEIGSPSTMGSVLALKSSKKYGKKGGSILVGENPNSQYVTPADKDEDVADGDVKEEESEDVVSDDTGEVPDADTDAELPKESVSPTPPAVTDTREPMVGDAVSIVASPKPTQAPSLEPTQAPSFEPTKEPAKEEEKEEDAPVKCPLKTFKKKGFVFKILSDGTVELKKVVNKSKKKVVVPGKIKYKGKVYKISKVHKKAFKGCKKLKKIIVIGATKKEAKKYKKLLS